jgi:hypothetical protein
LVLIIAQELLMDSLQSRGVVGRPQMTAMRAASAAPPELENNFSSLPAAEPLSSIGSPQDD